MVNELDNQKQLVKDDLDLLIKESNLGFYQSCEITTIFLYDKDARRAYNFYTIGVFEERKVITENTTQNITPKLITINDKYSMGIIREQRTLDDIKNSIHVLLEENKWTDSQGELGISNLRPLPKQFIPTKFINSVPLNSVLKNNFTNGSYVLEFFDEEKQQLKEILESDELVRKICKEIEQILPIDLLYISDRIGNIIFQFPSTLLAVDAKSLSLWEGLETSIAWHPLIKETDEIIIQASGSFDSSIMGIDQIDANGKTVGKLQTGNSNHPNDIIVYNKQKRLILSYLSLSFMKNIHISGFITQKYQEPRYIKQFDDNHKIIKSIEIPLVYQANKKKPEKIDYESRISNRIYENTKRNLEKNLIFVQYGRGMNDRDKALIDLRKLINLYGIDGIYLWDPYLSPEDIMDILYYYEVAGVPMKAISSYKSQKNQDKHKGNDRFKYWKENQRSRFEESSNHIGINFELRTPYSQYGWEFHDRFVIFPSDTGKPSAWSLGTSVNSLGKTHHILQKVSNAQLILDAFTELWEELEVPECLIWRTS